MIESPAGRLVSVTLRDVPIEIRRRRGSRLVTDASDDGKLLEAVELTRAIERPSDRVYWVPADAYVREIG